MISMERSVPVNPPGTASPISRAEVWKGLVLKADNALPFVPQMTFCQVTERIDDHRFVRDIEFRGDKMTEKVTLETERSVTFERLAGPVLGTIKNFIDEKDGQLALRFSFQLEVKGMAAGSAEEKDYAARMESAYLGAVDATLAAIRKVHDAAPPAWAKAFFADVDAMKMEPFLDHFAPEAKVSFGNHPPAVGRDQIKGAIGGLWDSIKGLRHDFQRAWPDGDGVVLESHVTYSRTDGKDVVTPCVSVLERRNGKVSELRIFIDLAPVFAP
jgi:ketosteroid isomerase-like protein